MTFRDGIRQLRNGFATKRPSMLGFVKYTTVTPAESRPEAWSSTEEYSVGDKVTYRNVYYRCKASSPAGTLPTDTTKWEVYSLTPEEYKLTFVNRNGDEFDFYYNSLTASSTTLVMKKELLDNILSDDWLIGLVADFESAADPSSQKEW